MVVPLKSISRRGTASATSRRVASRAKACARRIANASTGWGWSRATTMPVAWWTWDRLCHGPVSAGSCACAEVSRAPPTASRRNCTDPSASARSSSTSWWQVRSPGTTRDGWSGIASTVSGPKATRAACSNWGHRGSPAPMWAGTRSPELKAVAPGPPPRTSWSPRDVGPGRRWRTGSLGPGSCRRASAPLPGPHDPHHALAESIGESSRRWLARYDGARSARVAALSSTSPLRS